MRNLSLLRDKSLDIGAGLFVSIAILRHCFQYAYLTNNMLYYWITNIFACFMAWFYFKSGMFYKPQESKSIKNFCKEIAPKILFPFLKYWLYSCIVYIFMIAFIDGGVDVIYFKKILYDLIYYNATPNNGPLWFLISIFGVRFICNFFLRGGFLVLSVLIVFSYLISRLQDWHLPIALLNIPLGCVFFLLGYMFKKLQYDKKICIVSLIIVVVTLYFNPSYVGFRENILIRGNYFLFILFATCSICVCNYFLKRVCKLSLFGLTTLFSIIGKYSLPIFCINNVFIDAVYQGLQICGLKNIYQLVIYFSVAFVVIWIITYRKYSN